MARALAGMPASAQSLLTATTVAACLTLAIVARTWAITRAWLTPGPSAVPDLFDDVDALATRLEEAPRLGRPLRRLIAGGRRLSLRAARPARLHPWRSCAVIAVVFGCALSFWHSAIEGVPSLAAAIVIVPVYAAIGAGLVVVAYASVGRYLELIRRERS